MNPLYNIYAELNGTEDHQYTEKPEECLTGEEITYLYADKNNYEYVGFLVNQKGQIEKLYRAK